MRGAVGSAAIASGVNEDGAARKRRRPDGDALHGGASATSSGSQLLRRRRSGTGSDPSSIAMRCHVLGPPSALSDDILSALARPVVVSNVSTLLRGCSGPVIDMCFLAGYVHPTVIVILDGPLGPSDAGRVTALKHNRVAAALQLSGHGSSQGLVPLWQADGLPHDAGRVVACPEGGAVVISPSSVVYVSDTRKCAAAVNGHG